MRKLVPASLILILLLVSVFLWRSHQNKTAPNPPSSPASQTTYKKACDVFTLNDAVSILGAGASQTPSQTDSVSAQKSVTTCLYNYDPGSFSDLVSASVLLQGAPSAAAKQSFDDAKPAEAQPVSGYGDQAYWDPNLGQLHILKGQYWVIIAAGSGPLSQRDKDLPRKIADIIVKKL